VLGVEASATYAEVLARYERLFASNEKGGSFYLQSKVYRARESLEREYDEETVRREREAAAARRDGTQRGRGGRTRGGGGGARRRRERRRRRRAFRVSRFNERARRYRG
jgi:hypothetical protein